MPWFSEALDCFFGSIRDTRADTEVCFACMERL